MERGEPCYVENCRILSPHLENGVTDFGDLWNCRNSQVVGHSLFQFNAIPPQCLRATPIRNCDYTLKHVRNDLETAKSLKLEGILSIDLLTNIVSLEGNLKFQDDKSDKSHKEVISCRYVNENYRIDVIPPIDSFISEHVSQLISSREIEATHVVGGIIIGSSVTAFIKISQKESSDFWERSGGGKFSMAKLIELIENFSAEGKVHWSEKEISDNYDIKIDCKARPMPSDLAPPSSVTKLFELIEKMPATMKEEIHFNINNRGIFGVPIQFMLFPIAHFTRFKIFKLYKSLDNDLMDKFQVMLSKAIEIQQKDYVKKIILMRDKELAFLLNKNYLFSDRVRNFEDQLKQIGAKFVNISREQLREYKYGNCESEEFNTIIQEFEASDAGLIEKKIQEIIDEEASKVFMAKVTEQSHVKIFTNEQDKQMWKEEESNPKIILEIGPQCSKMAVNYYNQLIAPLGEIGMKMSLKTTSNAKELKLSLIINNQEDIFKDTDVEEAFEIFCANFRIGNRSKAEFFAVIAAIDGTEFPMRKILSELGVTLKVMLSLAEAYKHFEFADSVNELKHLISKLPADHLAFCVPIDAPETALDLLQTWKDYKLKDVAWIVYSFECNGELEEAPLLFVMSKSKVLAICLERLDLLILEEKIKETEKICDVNFDLFSIDQLSKSFHKLRASYAFRFLSRIFPNSIRRANQTFVKTETRSEVTEFLSFVRKCLSSNELVILSSVAEGVVFEFPNLISTLTKYGWNDKSKMFSRSISNDKSGTEMVSEIEKWLKDDSIIKIDQSAGLCFSACYEIANLSHCPIEIKSQLEDCKSAEYSDSNGRVLGIKKDLRILEKHVKSHFSFVHARIFLKALNLVIFSEKQSVDALIKLLIKEYYQNMKTHFPDKLIENYVQNNQTYLLLQEMSPYKYESWMCAFFKGLQTLCHLDDVDTLTHVIQDLSDLCTDINFTTQLWKNEKWLLLVRRCLNVKNDNDFLLLRSIFGWIKKMGIECFVPDDIQLKLKSMEIVGIEHLSSVEDVERFLEREIFERVNMPWYSTRQLTCAFQENPSLERELIQIGAAIHWDSNNKLFTAEWSNMDMRQALGKIKWRTTSRFENFKAALFKDKERLLSLDMMAYILSTVDRACAQSLLEVFSKLSHPLPLIIPDIGEKNKFIVTLPLLQNIVIRWHINRLVQNCEFTDANEYTETMDAGENPLFLSPFRLIVAVGIDEFSTEKSQFLNKLMARPYYFSSDADANKNGTLAGTVEFLWLTRETCPLPEYDCLSLDSHYSKNGNEILLLANLHGNALDFPDIVNYLKKLTSCFIVFGKSQNLQFGHSFRNFGNGPKMKMLESWLSGCPCVGYFWFRGEENILDVMKKAITFKPKWKNRDQSIVEELPNTESIYITESATN